MDLNVRLQNVAVIGAAGKMGSGIALLMAQEAAFLALANPDATYIVNLIDVSDKALFGLLSYIRDQSRKTAEKQINRLRTLFAERSDLIENTDMVEAYVREVMLHLRTGKSLSLAADSLLIFEAVFEKEELKFAIYKELARLCPSDAFFLTNTSSIPIHVIAKACGLTSRIIGYHFYNPPAVQKLLEVITPENCSSDLKATALDLAKRLGKTVVHSNDIAGFIGNGHFMRDVLHAISEVERLSAQFGYAQSIYMIDTVSRDYLLRPMGIFQLIDYVGIDVCQLILTVMSGYQPGADLHSPFLDRVMAAGIKGGQTSSGAQKDGFLKYERSRPVAVYDLQANAYVPIADIAGKADAQLGTKPEGNLSWKVLQKDPARDQKLRSFFASFTRHETLGIELARRYFQASRSAAQLLVESGVAATPADVNLVLTLGFFHLYGPINDYM
jgi:3-hydroxyacyl-CoA dehydrogenase